MNTGESAYHGLSEAGIKRREEMLVEMLGHVRARRRRRRASAALIVIAPVALGLAWLAWPRGQAPQPIASSPPARASSLPGPARPAPAAPRIEFIATDPRAADRLKLASAPTDRVEMIGDGQLIDALVESGRTSGLVRVGSRVTVVDQKSGATPSDAPGTDGGRSQGLVDPAKAGHAAAGIAAL